MNFRKTKIICTMGPAVRDIEILKQLLIEGMNIARFNFSHGDHEYHKGTIDMLREASRTTGIPVALLLDTKGPEIRTGRIKEDKTINLIRGNKISLTTDDVEGTESLLSISYKTLPKEVSAGKHIFIADGLVNLEVINVENNIINCIVRNGGVIGSKKNVNVIGVKTSLPAVTEQDVKDIIFGVENNMDFIAASFIRKPLDVKEIRGIIDICDSKINIISKIEDEEGLENIDEIIRVSNGIMVARGDLGVQIKAEEIPLVQKRIILKCNLANKPVITATQMLDSMINNPIPTRAESTDVANAIFDGTDAIMLSGETASGKYPVQAVQMMNNIALLVENSPEYIEKRKSYFEFSQNNNNMADTIAKASYVIASEIKANAILTPTLHGTTPKLISKYRPMQKIIAVTTSEEVQRNLLLYWGVFPIITDIIQDSDTMLNNALKVSLEKNFVKNFDKIVIVAGVPVNSPIMLNLIRVHLICNVLGKGSRGFGKSTSGKIVKANNLEEAMFYIKGDGNEILLTKYLDENFKPILKKINGYILEEFSISWEEIHNENPDIVAIAGVLNAMNTLENNLIITIDGEEKLIYEGIIDSKK